MGGIRDPYDEGEKEHKLPIDKGKEEGAGI